MGWFRYLLGFLLVHLTLAAIRMSQPKILLPFHPRHETNFTLEATDGCFLWSSSRPDLVRIDPLEPFSIKNGEKCSLHANVIAHTKQSLRASATVYARDVLTGQSVRCDVIIDKIQTIEIVYTTTRLYLEDAPELFKLRAHDQHGSTFSSIEHFSYEWRLLNAAIVDDQSVKKSTSTTLDATKVIRILRLTDSSYEMSETVRNLESHGSLSYEILLEGLRTGSAFVQAEIIDNDLYHGIRTKPVRLSVSANVQFYPSTDVYLLPYSRLAFRLYQIKRQESTDITDLPSTRILYEVKLINNDAGYLDDQTLCCSHLDFDIFIDNNIFQYQGIIPSNEHTNQSCALLIFKPLKIGSTNIRVNLKKSNLQQTIQLSAYENLHINRNQLLLTTKSRYTLQLSHGPTHIHDQESLKYDITPIDHHVEFKQDSTNPYLLHIKCVKPIQHGQYHITKQNLVSKQNLCPIQSTISIDITCQSTIHSLSFEPILNSQCPLSNRDYIITYFDEILPVKIIAYNENQIPFDNFTSLKLDCSIKSNEDLADLRLNNPLEIIPKQKPGKILLQCSIDKIEQQIEIEFISNIQLLNSVKLIYINESLSPLEISGGSGYFKFQTNELATNPLIHLIITEDNPRLVYIKPLNFGHTTLMIIDQCLPSSKKKLDVIISDIDHLKIFGRSRLELNTTSLIYVQAMDIDGNLFNLTNIYHLINIVIEQSRKPTILFIEYEPKSNIDHQTIAYRIHTLDIGRTNLRLHTIHIKSNLIEFEVYEKLRIEPRELNVLPLSTIQLKIIGGSQLSGTTIEWLTNDTNIVDLETNNIFKTKHIGHAVIHAKSIGIDPLLGESVVYGEDFCSINVVQIHSIRLHIPTTEVLPNKFVPLTVLPYDHKKNPIVITDVFLHSLIFTWSLTNTHLAQFRPIIGNISSYTRTFVTNIETLNTGRVTIDVRLSTNSKNLNKLLLKSSHEISNSIELNILEPFYLNHFDETRTILLGPNSRLNLYHIPNDITLELLSSSKNIHFDTETKTLVTDQNQHGEAVLYMKYRGIKQEKKSLSSSIVGAYLVQVKPIHYILLQSYLPQETSALFSSIPVDYKLPLTVSYHDELGRRFDATSISLNTYSYRHDMISTNSNNTQTYEIVSLKNGSNILVFDGGLQNLRAYLPVQSNSGFVLPKTSISPLKQTYYIGDIVCFESNLNNDENNKDRWTGDDGMYVDSKYGIGQMIIDGERHLHLKIDGQTITSERFNVQVPNEIKLYKGTNDFLYDGEEGMKK
ncbi:unnamed protein product [Adineta steineri]|uniref:Uncharacterized protein n=1 Tax=Adineta steineri TaxID=433720 RepID=A0A814DYP0_9BILA|nr:unnamed protein product [Adineta steineri]